MKYIDRLNSRWYKTLDFLAMILLMAAIALCVFKVVDMAEEEQKLQLRSYCANVELWMDSAGKYGHPDYDNIYFMHCGVPK